jgi:hypothetical protein
MLVFLYTDQVPFMNTNDRDQLNLARDICIYINRVAPLKLSQ